ncbi:MAG: alpha/beta hydrolase [Myxococcales bacterium]|nr:alpha/beta hydrolase [Myxococcales bacterium]
MLRSAVLTDVFLAGCLALVFGCSSSGGGDTGTGSEPLADGAQEVDGDGSQMMLATSSGDPGAAGNGPGGSQTSGGADPQSSAGAPPPAGMDSALVAMASNGVGADVEDGKVLPIVFVHGFAGSAQQYQSQAMRWEQNGYPQDLIRAFDHDGAGLAIAEYADGVDAFIDQMLTDFPEYDQVYLIGHSRGTRVSNTYLMDEARRAKVAKYISLDGAPCPMTVACLAPTQKLLPGQAHVEVATSAESFAMQYEFIMGAPPATMEITKQDGPVTLSGRAVLFPQNVGGEGVLEFWEIDSQTGERVTETPLASFQIDDSGAFGPVTVDPDKLYEMRLYRPDLDTEQHVYTQRTPRDSSLVRILSQDPETSTSRTNSNLGPGHAMLIAMRMREWYETDVLEIGTSSEAGTAEPVNVITDAVGRGNIALHLHDAAASPGDTSLGELPYFPDQPFQTGLDVYMPAADPPNGTITVTNYPRGDMERPQTLVFPNWSSDRHSISVMFSDYAHD